MAFSYNIDEVPPVSLPSVEHDVNRAKTFLLRRSSTSGDSLYDHLSQVLNKILSERPRNPADVFDDYSRIVKEERLRSKCDNLREVFVPHPQCEEARKLLRLFQIDGYLVESHAEGELNDDDDGPTEKSAPDMMDLLFFFEQTGVGLPRSVMVLLNLSIRRLMSNVQLENVRFWGKILGNPRNYYVLEAKLSDSEASRRESERLQADENQGVDEMTSGEENIGADLAEQEAQNEGAKDTLSSSEKAPAPPTAVEGQQNETGLRLDFPDMPRAIWKEPIQPPPEPIGTGTNKMVYFVCNSPGADEWIELPSVTPQQIVAARQIIRCFTGNLDTPLLTYPPFPGTEKNYLRAQIARITAATLISPIGIYTFGSLDEEEEEEMGEEEASIGNVISVNPHYDPLPIGDLVEPTMSNWCHHSPYILEQGRSTWWQPPKDDETAPDEEDEEVAEEEEEIEGEESEEGGEVKREIGPPLLTPLSEDASPDSMVPWCARQSTLFCPDIAVALVRSNVWPGAFAFASEKRFANIYIGWGSKYTTYSYNPPPLPMVQDQYRIGPEIMEMNDPTFEEEEAYRISQLPITKLPLDGGEEGGEGNSEEEESEED